MHGTPLTMRQDHRLMHTPANRAVGGRRIASALGLGVVLISILLRGLAQQDDMHVAKRIPPILSTGMGGSETHPYRYETLYDGTVTASLATPIRRDDDQLLATMIDVLRSVFAIPSGTDLSVSMEHVSGVVGLEQPTVGEPADHPAADLLGDGRHRVRRQGRGLAELDPARRRRLEYTVPGVQARRVSGPTRGRTRPRG